ncbi:hypothetical protein MtrunA17_Chr4g0057591 [Medicago truncatula]|uniref:Uncharacterized protein n=1 Tax=Medicago truncatula TaxID=3880 RepID=B7FML3_MEDTR|nr:unknown [Medicago truncatula]RHN63373.1 hypothetical protein MtrunA17_Chr4g0057591 [Medicago truncatula]
MKGTTFPSTLFFLRRGKGLFRPPYFVFLLPVIGHLRIPLLSLSTGAPPSTTTTNLLSPIRRKPPLSRSRSSLRGFFSKLWIPWKNECYVEEEEEY